METTVVFLTGGAAAAAAGAMGLEGFGAAVATTTITGTVGGATEAGLYSALMGNDANTVTEDAIKGGLLGGIIGGASGGLNYRLSQVKVGDLTTIGKVDNVSTSCSEDIFINKDYIINSGEMAGSVASSTNIPEQTPISKGYNPKPGERTIEGYVKKNANPEISLDTNSPGFNNNSKGTGGIFKRIGAEEHGGISPHIHQPQRNVAPNGDIFGKVGSKTADGGVTLPGKKDIKQLYEYLENGKYH